MATAQVKTSAEAHLWITLWAMLIVSTNKHLIKNWAQTCTKQTVCPKSETSCARVEICSHFAILCRLLCWSFLLTTADRIYRGKTLCSAVKLSKARLILFSVVLGLCLVAISTLLSPFGRSTTGHGSIGFPVAYGSQIDCYLSGPGGCGYSYDLILIALDCFFWVAIAFAIVFESIRIHARFPRR